MVLLIIMYIMIVNNEVNDSDYVNKEVIDSN